MLSLSRFFVKINRDRIPACIIGDSSNDKKTIFQESPGDLRNRFPKIPGIFRIDILIPGTREIGIPIPGTGPVTHILGNIGYSAPKPNIKIKFLIGFPELAKVPCTTFNVRSSGIVAFPTPFDSIVCSASTCLTINPTSGLGTIPERSCRAIIRS